MRLPAPSPARARLRRAGLIVPVLLLGGLVQACGGSDDAVPRSFAATVTPTTSAFASPTTTVAPTTSATPTPTTAPTQVDVGVPARPYVAAPQPLVAAQPAPKPAPKPAAPKPAAPKPAVAQPVESGGSAYYKNCAAVRAAGKAPIRAGQPGYSTKLDGDGDGVACE